MLGGFRNLGLGKTSHKLEVNSNLGGPSERNKCWFALDALCKESKIRWGGRTAIHGWSSVIFHWETKWMEGTVSIHEWSNVVLYTTPRFVLTCTFGNAKFLNTLYVGEHLGMFQNEIMHFIAGGGALIKRAKSWQSETGISLSPVFSQT